MSESILQYIKKKIGIDESETHFDEDIIGNINTALGILTQLGVGNQNGFSITDENDTWASFLGTVNVFEPVKSYIHLKVKLLFDPPANTTLMESINRTISELEWRIVAHYESTSNTTT